jgi:hypothetical protein
MHFHLRAISSEIRYRCVWLGNVLPRFENCSSEEGRTCPNANLRILWPAKNRYFGVGCRTPHCFRASSRSIDEYFSGTITTFPLFCLTCRILRSVRLLFHFIPAGKSPSTYCQLGPMTQIPACLTMRQGWSPAKLGTTRKSRRSKLRIGSLAYSWPLAPGVWVRHISLRHTLDVGQRRLRRHGALWRVQRYAEGRLQSSNAKQHGS